MYKVLTLVWALLIPSMVFSQRNTKWVKILESVDSIIDINKKRYALNEASNSLKDQLVTRDAVEIANASKEVIYAVSDDKTIECIAFGSTTYSGLFELKYLIKESRTGEEAVWQFDEELVSKQLKSIHNLPVSIEINSRLNLFQLSFKTNSGQHKGIIISDLITKCYFEKLQLQENDQLKDSINDIISLRLNTLWSDASFYDDDLSYLKRMKTIFSKSKKVKISTYNVQKSDFVHQFYGAIINKLDGQVMVYPLNDVTPKIKSPERATLNNKKWFGAIYLDVVEVSDKNKTMYTLLGYKGHDEFIKTRVLDVLIIQNKRLRFGAPVFKVDRLTRHRMIYKYSAGANMMLRYDAKLKMIVMDNLEPAESFYRGVHRFYGPDFSYNAFEFQKGYWEFTKDIDLRNPKGNTP